MHRYQFLQRRWCGAQILKLKGGSLKTTRINTVRWKTIVLMGTLIFALKGLPDTASATSPGKERDASFYAPFEWTFTLEICADKAVTKSEDPHFFDREKGRAVVPGKQASLRYPVKGNVFTNKGDYLHVGQTCWMVGTERLFPSILLCQGMDICDAMDGRLLKKSTSGLKVDLNPGKTKIFYLKQ